MSEIEASAARVIEGYKSAVAARDVAAFMRLYDPAARVFDAWGIWSYEGVSAWQIAVEGWFASHATDRLKVSFDDVRSVATPALTSVTAIVTYAVVSAQGEPLNAMQNRLTWVLKTSGHVLRIIHEHTSAPVGFEDGKAILQRPGKS
jgi:ketosteroid isomerase-like protein